MADYANLIRMVGGQAYALRSETGSRIESEIARYMRTYPATCPGRDKAVRIMRDALAELIADNVADGTKPAAETVRRYGILAAMARANMAASLERERS